MMRMTSASDAELAKWLDELPENLMARVVHCAFRYGRARKTYEAATKNEELRQRVDDRRVALHHALDAAFAWRWRA